MPSLAVLCFVMRRLFYVQARCFDMGQPNSLSPAGVPLKQHPGNLLLYLYQEGEKKRGQAAEGMPEP